MNKKRVQNFLTDMSLFFIVKIQVVLNRKNKAKIQIYLDNAFYLVEKSRASYMIFIRCRIIL